jgi:transcriptional regulator with XRE-family HTH domain
VSRRPTLVDPASSLGVFALELRSLRDRLGVDAPGIDDISVRENIPRSTLYAALRGARLPSRKVVAALARAWGADEATWLAKRNAVEAGELEREASVRWSVWQL